MSGHTPTPWFVQPHFLTIYSMSHGDSGLTCAVASVLREQPGYEIAKANAAFIVRAVNAHEALVDAAKRLAVLDNNGDGRSFPSIEDCAAARAALALAETQP